jgi:hypothetical protein
MHGRGAGGTLNARASCPPLMQAGRAGHYLPKHTATMLEEITSVLETKNRNVNSMFQQMAKLRGAYVARSSRLRRQRTIKIHPSTYCKNR